MALRHYGITTLQHCGIAALWHCGIAALQHYDIAALQHCGTAALQRHKVIIANNTAHTITVLICQINSTANTSSDRSDHSTQVDYKIF